jgi:hypothetical protein
MGGEMEETEETGSHQHVACWDMQHVFDDTFGQVYHWPAIYILPLSPSRRLLLSCKNVSSHLVAIGN